MFSKDILLKSRIAWYKNDKNPNDIGFDGSVSQDFGNIVGTNIFVFHYNVPNRHSSRSLKFRIVWHKVDNNSKDTGFDYSVHQAFGKIVGTNIFVFHYNVSDLFKYKIPKVYFDLLFVNLFEVVSAAYNVLNTVKRGSILACKHFRCHRQIRCFCAVEKCQD